MVVMTMWTTDREIGINDNSPSMGYWAGVSKQEPSDEMYRSDEMSPRRLTLNDSERSQNLIIIVCGNCNAELKVQEYADFGELDNMLACCDNPDYRVE